MTTTERNELVTSLKDELAASMAANKLTGTDKQVAWADSIRREYIERRVDECADAHDMYVIKIYAEWMITTHADVKYWIDNRNALALVKRQTMVEYGKIVGREVLLDKSLVYTAPAQESTETVESTESRKAQLAQLIAERDALQTAIAALPPVDPDDEVMQVFVRGDQYKLELLNREIAELQEVQA